MRILIVSLVRWSDLDNIEHALRKEKVDYHQEYAHKFSWPQADEYDLIVQLGLSEKEDEGIAFLCKLERHYPNHPILLATKHLSPIVEAKARAAAPRVEFMSRQFGNPLLLLSKFQQMARN